jgi:hypothetical protein
MEILPDFTLTDIKTSGATIRLRHAGKGPGLLLLHGNPLTHLAWHKIAPRLAEHFHVVAADLRGYGDSSAPPEEPDSSNYSFRAMAQDQVEVMRTLGHEGRARTTIPTCQDSRKPTSTTRSQPTPSTSNRSLQSSAPWFQCQ